MAPLYGSPGRRTEQITTRLPTADTTQGPTRSAGVPSQISRGHRCTISSPLLAKYSAVTVKVVLIEGLERVDNEDAILKVLSKWTLFLEPGILAYMSQDERFFWLADFA